MDLRIIENLFFIHAQFLFSASICFRNEKILGVHECYFKFVTSLFVN